MRRKRLMRLVRFYVVILLAGANAGYVYAQNPRVRSLQQAQGSTTPVAGSGTPNQLTKWTGVSGQDTFTVGNSIITETKFGLSGIGTPTPSSKLTVVGTIESLDGGIKFPDGTVQTTAGLSSLFRDATLIGNGTAGSPLGIAPFGVSTLQLANGSVTGQKIANGSVVRSFNGLFDNIQLTAGSNITITPSGNTLTIAAPNVLTAVNHDATLAGNGTSSDLLGIAAGGVGTTQLSNGAVTAPKLNTLTAPSSGQFLGFDGSSLVWQTLAGSGSGVATDLTLNGNGSSGSPLKVAIPLTLEGSSSSILSVRNLTGGSAIVANGGNDNTSNGGDGLQALGGNSGIDDGGAGVVALGGASVANGRRSGDGILAVAGIGANGAANGLAGSFLGNVGITGNLNVTGTKNFKIDHPLDPENKYLYHAAVESSEVLNVYSGNVTTDANGDAVIEMPGWFEAINKDFRYQLTTIGAFAQAIVAGKIRDNRFTIKTSQPNVEVSWQVTGVRSDRAMLKHPFKMEEEKSAAERGHYLTPEAFDQPEEKSIQWARHSEPMKKRQERREQLNQGQRE